MRDETKSDPPPLSTETKAIVGTGIGLAGLILTVMMTMNSRFDDVNQRFDDVNRRFDDVNRRFDDVNQRFDDVNRRFDDLRQDQHERFRAIEQRLRSFDDRLRAIEIGFGRIDQRLEIIERTVLPGREPPAEPADDP